MESPESSEATASALFDRWSDALLARRAPDGSLACPACDVRHGRIVELAFPFVRRHLRSGEARWLDAAAGVVDWADHRLLRPDGAYANDSGDGWFGTTEFALIALSRALLAGGDALPAALRERWLGIVRRQAAWARAWLAPPDARANVNYRAAHALAMERAARVLGDADGALRVSGAAQARRALSLVAPEDGLLAGECHPLDRVSPRGFRGVDVGYNLEETLPALVEWAELAGDAAALDAALRCARAHLPFLLPDGAIDDSFGTRAHKWSYWGSRTSDGVLPLLAALARRGDATAAARIPAVLGLYRRCTTSDGLLAGGPHYEAAGEPPCLHHSLSHLGSLAVFLEGSKVQRFEGSKVRRFSEVRSCRISAVAGRTWRRSVRGARPHLVALRRPRRRRPLRALPRRVPSRALRPAGPARAAALRACEAVRPCACRRSRGRRPSRAP